MCARYATILGTQDFYLIKHVTKTFNKTAVPNEINKDESLDDIQHFIEAQRPENTTKELTTTKLFGTGSVKLNYKRSQKVRQNASK